MRDFKKLNVWKTAYDFCLQIYEATARFPIAEQYGLTQQLRRASVSISSNIAEGCGRGSNPDFLRFLYHALGSAKECENQLMLAKDLGYLQQTTCDNLLTTLTSIQKQLISLIKALQAEGRSPHTQLS